jgi:hypothetical protein
LEESYVLSENKLKRKLQDKYDLYSGIVKEIWEENHKIPKRGTRNLEIRRSAIKVIKKIEEIAKEKGFELE